MDDREVIEVDSVRLYLPDELMARRVGDVGPLAAYIKEIQRSTGAFLQGIDRTSAKGLFIAVGIKPGGKSRAWCEAIEGTIPDARLEELAQVIGMIPAIEVKEGAVAFAIELNLWGRTPDAFPELPGAWSQAAKGSNEPLSIPDGVFAVVWPD